MHGRQHDQKCRLKSSQYTFIIPHRVIQLTTISFWVSESTNKQIPSEASEEPSDTIIHFYFSSSTGELCSQPIRGNDHRIGRMFPEHVEWSFLDPKYSFDEYIQLGLQRNIHPIKNGLNSNNTEAEHFWIWRIGQTVSTCSNFSKSCFCQTTEQTSHSLINYIHLHIHIYIYIYIWHVCIHVYTCACMCTHVCMHTHMQWHASTHTLGYCTHTLPHACMHTHTHTRHTHNWTLLMLLPLVT